MRQAKPHNKGNDVAHNNTKKDRRNRREALEGVLKDENRDQRDQAERKIPQRAVIRACVAAAKETDADGEQTQADGHHDRTGHDGREELTKGLNAEAESHFKDTADQRRSHNCAVSIQTCFHTCSDRAGGDARHHT